MTPEKIENAYVEWCTAPTAREFEVWAAGVQWALSQPSYLELGLQMPAAAKIAQCPDASMWYAKMIGQRFEIFRIDRQGYWTRDPDGYLNFIHPTDAVLLAKVLQE